MDNRAAKLALARKKLKDHQEKKTVQKDDINPKSELNINLDISMNSDLKYSNVHNIDEFMINPSSEGMAEALYADNPVPYNIHTDANIAHLPPASSVDLKSTNSTENIQNSTNDINVTEILISNKRNLELQVHDLQAKLSQLENEHVSVINNFKLCNQKVNDLENELQNINSKYVHATQEILRKDAEINDLTGIKLSLTEENGNLLEQFEFTKAVLSAKEAETGSLHSQLYNLQNQYEVIHLQLQQLTNGSPTCPPSERAVENEKNEVLLQKIAGLEHQLNLLQKERDQINLHYEHYVAELNEQLKSAVIKNEELNREVQSLSNRENEMIEHISDMEIRIQKYNLEKKKLELDQNCSNMKVLQDDLKQVQDALYQLQAHHKELLIENAEREAKLREYSVVKVSTCNHEDISISKLSADMTSDKVAAQRATEQNKKLKQDIQGLEDAFIKMSKDKLELTEKLTAEKYLNRELTIKLAEVEEKAKDMQITLKAKDEEMIRLQSNYREIETQYAQLKQNSESYTSTTSAHEEHAIEVKPEDSYSEVSKNEHIPLTEEVENNNSIGLQKDDAMSKLQERFLKIMGEVADLSDEKHRLEHIILQLQNETDTICEYVALYQQQRILLKRRDEERSAQLKIFQQECGKLKYELEELSGILARFAEDKELMPYFQIETRRVDMERVMTLLTNLKNNALIDTKKKNIEFKNFYPCNCCSGQLIDV